MTVAGQLRMSFEHQLSFLSLFCAQTLGVHAKLGRFWESTLRPRDQTAKRPHQTRTSPVRRSPVTSATTVPATSDLSMHPIEQLPNELLAIVMGDCIALSQADSPYMARPTMFIYHLSPLPLSQVCRLWRTTARSTPSLWTEIDLNLGAIKRPPPWILLLQTYLALSGALPLTVELSWVSLNSHVTLDALASSGVLAGIVSRSSILRLNIWYQISLPHSLREVFSRTQMTALRELRFAWLPLGECLSGMQLPQAPGLRLLEWTDLHGRLAFSIQPGEDATFYPQLTSARIQCQVTSSQELEGIFLRMPNLRSLSLFTTNLRPRSPAVYIPFLGHDKLERIEWTAREHISPIIAASLRLPGARHALLDLPHPSFITLQTVTTLLDTTFPNLVELEVNVRLSVPTADALRALDQLVILTLNGSAEYVAPKTYASPTFGAGCAVVGAEPFFKRMASEPWVCPGLEQFDMRSCELESGSVSERAAMITFARTRSAAAVLASGRQSQSGRGLRRMRMHAKSSPTIRPNADPMRAVLLASLNDELWHILEDV
ncbi:hypothetical protein BKA62DRAFT_672318 [Auriculariales sp. MPI-PUGE-AT-0066]|nr:hypothetical protein BKA62DRAFT_672318 [Auriculariales sp. MPI-PUGE-AT-0066]